MVLENALCQFLNSFRLCTTAGSLIWRKYCTKVKFRQTLGGGGLKQITGSDFLQFEP